MELTGPNARTLQRESAMRGTIVNWSRVMVVLSLLVLSILAARPAHASNGQDRVSFGQKIFIAENETVGDVVCFLCSIENHGAIHGDVVSFIGGVKSDGLVHGDMVSFLGDVSVAGEGSVTGDLVIFGGNLRKSGQAQLSSEQVIFPFGFLLLPVVVFVAIVWGLSHAFRRRPTYFVPSR